MIFYFKNKILFGDSCSGKTYYFKKINIKKIDIDYFLLYKKIFFLNEYFFRIFEKKINLIINNINLIIILGGGAIQFQIKNYLIYKNISIIEQKKRQIKDNFNRPSIKNNIFLKIRFCIRKKHYIKISNYYFLKCYKCNFLFL
ncbi:MAG: hypothetical protein ACSLEG_00130 [Candidatus Carsonella ruddii]